ncbi:hypothetical protein F383_24526 [Gossypium arboreum]|uniref:Uncharacterized protein n=1 Tax=Gossypium arboreum TaxID=29729 RepID=A0A0B0MPT4_GOSAR|nr:hypothetical protein F383_24526 [Gossypium arboreum]
MVTKTHNIAHFPRIFAKDVIHLQSKSRRNKIIS